MFERISNSFALARSSWQVLRTDKQLIVFPILSGIACFMLLLAIWLPVIFGIGLKNLADNGVPPWIYGVAFAYYFVTWFVVIFFNSALVSCAIIRFNGGTPTLGDGIGAATARLPQILAWAFVSATVGILLKLIENAGERVAEIISAILGTVWTVMTYFVVPVLVVEKVGPIEAIKRSASILKKTWGEALVGRMGIGFFMFLLALPGIALLLVGGFVATKPALLALGIALIALAVIYFLAVAAISVALQGIFISALYQYATNGQIPSGYDAHVMRSAFGHKKSA
jgi:hypothetical protein